MARMPRDWTLPPDFAWYAPDIELGPTQRRVLKLGGKHGVEVAFVRERVDSLLWSAMVNRHLPWAQQRRGLHQSRDHAVRMATRWVVVNASRIRGQVAGRRSAGAQILPVNPTP